MVRNKLLLFLISCAFLLSLPLSYSQQCSQPADCGAISSGNICLDYSLSTKLPASANSGKIFYVSCSDTAVLSDGTTWLPCRDFAIKTVNGHDYLCTGGLEKGNETAPAKVLVKKTLDIAQNANNYNIAQNLGNLTEPANITMTISSNVIIGSASASLPALTTGNLPLGSIITLINNGKIFGAGGSGGQGSTGGAGDKGGDAIFTSVPISIENNGIIGSGGGGGGGGSKGGCRQCYDDPGSGGGGGSGSVPGQGGGPCGASPGGDAASGNYNGGSTGGVCGSSKEAGQATTGARGGNLGSDGSSSTGIGGKAGSSVVLNGNAITWIKQGDLRGPVNPSGNAIVQGHGKESWIECCGTGTCTSSPAQGGRTLTTGKSVFLQDTSYFCTNAATFVQDLDTLDGENCENAGFKWTGNLCCGDDESEYYNDANGIGGCWNNQVVQSGALVDGTTGIGNYNGLFFGCKVTDPSILSIKDFHTKQALLSNEDFCFQDPNKLAYCAINSTWQASFGQDKSHLAFSQDSQSSACCPQNNCWNGNECVQNQASNPKPSDGETARCINGNWTVQIKKFDVNGNPGYCPGNNQCLVNVNGLFSDNNNPSANPQCISGSQYIKDNYCDNGNWTSRTKSVALQLLDIAGSNDYAIFCDSAAKSLNRLNYAIGTQNAKDLATADTNKFCVISFEGNAILGTSLNKDLVSGSPILKALETGVTSCKNIGTVGTSNCWYDAQAKLLYYSRQPFSIQSPNQDSIKSSFMQIVEKIIGMVLGESMESPKGEESFNEDLPQFLSNLGKFDKLYISKVGSKEIRATISGFQEIDIVLEYRSFDTDICKFIEDYETNVVLKGNTKPKDTSGMECRKEGNAYYVLVQGSGLPFQNLNPESIWTDLTSELRVG